MISGFDLRRWINDDLREGLNDPDRRQMMMAILQVGLDSTDPIDEVLARLVASTVIDIAGFNIEEMKLP